MMVLQFKGSVREAFKEKKSVTNIALDYRRESTDKIWETHTCSSERILSENYNHLNFKHFERFNNFGS